MARKSRANNALIISDTKNKMWNAGLYGRLSVEDGDDTEQNSIGNQKKIGNRFLADKPDIVLVDTYSDAAVIIGLKTLRLKKCQKHAAF